jgi:hypothetical protein
VLSGLVKVELLRAKQQTSYFVGVGGSVGYLSSLLGRDYPGVTLLAAFAQVTVHLQCRCVVCIPQLRVLPVVASMTRHVYKLAELISYMEAVALCGCARQCGLPQQRAGKRLSRGDPAGSIRTGEKLLLYCIHMIPVLSYCCRAMPWTMNCCWLLLAVC